MSPDILHWMIEIAIALIASAISLCLVFRIAIKIRVSKLLVTSTTQDGTGLAVKLVNKSFFDALDVHLLLVYWQPHHFVDGTIAFESEVLSKDFLPYVYGRNSARRQQPIPFTNVRIWSPPVDVSKCWERGFVEFVIIGRHAFSGRTICQSMKYGADRVVPDGVFSDKELLSVIATRDRHVLDGEA